MVSLGQGGGSQVCTPVKTHQMYTYCECILLYVNYTSMKLILKKINSSENPFVTMPLSKFSQAVFSSPVFL